MARRAVRNKMRDRGRQESANIHTLYPTGINWTPLESEVRDRKYVKNVRALSPVQQIFLDAIEERSVILALGPAGTGKTEKLAPYLRPLYDALTERLGTKRLKALLADGTIEIAPVAYMRGRTLNDCFIVIDEAQNCTYGQIKMLLTRLGWRSTMVLTGDPDQTDLLPGLSGLREIAARLERVETIAVVRLGEADIVRHPLVGEMLGVL
jgi:phosphate starvation-inducible PhoH-like protein